MIRDKRITKTPEVIAAQVAEMMYYERLRSNASTKEQVIYIQPRVENNKFIVMIKKKYHGTFDTVREAQVRRDEVFATMIYTSEGV